MPDATLIDSMTPCRCTSWSVKTSFTTWLQIPLGTTAFQGRRLQCETAMEMLAPALMSCDYFQQDSGWRVA